MIHFFVFMCNFIKDFFNGNTQKSSFGLHSQYNREICLPTFKKLRVQFEILIFFHITGTNRKSKYLCFWMEMEITTSLKKKSSLSSLFSIIFLISSLKKCQATFAYMNKKIYYHEQLLLKRNYKETLYQMKPNIEILFFVHNSRGIKLHAYSREGRANLVLRHSVHQILPNFLVFCHTIKALSSSCQT